jgi:DNA replication protein DnaC
LLFEFFADRYLTRATALTTNLPFAPWTSVFGNATMTVAVLERLTHRSHVLLFNGESYRLRDSRSRIQRARTTPLPEEVPPMPPP